MDIASESERKDWAELRRRASERLPAHFAAGVVRAARLGRERRRVRFLAFGGAALVLVLAYGALASTRVEAGRKREALWNEYRQGQGLALRTL